MSSEERWQAGWAERERLLRLARRRLGSREDAEDVVAEVLHRVGTQEGLDPQAVPAWSTRVAINLCIDRQRRLATQRALLARAELRPEVVDSPEDHLADLAEARWLDALARELPERNAHVLRLRATGLSNRAIAAQLGVSSATVEGLLKRARAALRAAAQSAGAVLGALCVGRRASRGGLVLALAALLGTLLLLPYETDPPSASPPTPGAVKPASPATVTEATSGSATGTSSRNEGSATAAAGAARAGDARRGSADPYLGPTCLAPYCLPLLDDATDKQLGATSPRGWSPADLWSYLGEPATAPEAQRRAPVVAVLGVYAHDWVLRDLEVYREIFHLPACTEQNGCLRVLDTGSRTSPSDGLFDAAGYAQSQASSRQAQTTYNNNPGSEQDQMLQAVSAACPECHLLLIRAIGNGPGNLAALLRLAQQQHPDVIAVKEEAQPRRNDVGTSYSELLDPDLYAPSVVVNAGGAAGYGASGAFPRRVAQVIGVGGSVVSDGRVQVDPDNASFCDESVPVPSWQRGLDTGCPGRAGMDLTMPAGVATGLATYVSGGLGDVRGWYHPGHGAQAVGLFAGLFARHGLSSAVHGPEDLYAHPEWFADLVTGSTDCTDSGCYAATGFVTSGCRPGARQICDARPGWDGASGLGEPRHLPWL